MSGNAMGVGEMSQRGAEKQEMLDLHFQDREDLCVSPSGAWNETKHN